MVLLYQVPAHSGPHHKRKHRHRLHEGRRERWLSGPGGGMTLIKEPGAEDDGKKPAGFRPEKVFRKPCDMTKRYNLTSSSSW